MITIKIDKKAVLALVVFITIIAGLGVSTAYNSGGTGSPWVPGGADPETFGHSIDEIDGLEQFCQSDGTNCPPGLGRYESDWTYVDKGETYSFNHSLGYLPDTVTVYFSLDFDEDTQSCPESGITTINMMHDRGPTSEGTIWGGQVINLTPTELQVMFIGQRTPAPRKPEGCIKVIAR